MSKKPKPAPAAAPTITTDSGSAPAPIGVPQNYLAPKPYQVDVWDPGSGTVGSGEYPYTPPRYYKGYEYTPAAMSPDQIAELQGALEAIGLKGYIPGVWDTRSQSAFESLLGWANAAGVTWEEMLSSIGSQGGGSSGGGGGGGGGGLGPAPISDEDITALAQKVSQGVLGRNLRPEELGNFIPAFRGIYQAQETTPQVGAENLIRHDIAPQGEADAHQVGNVMDTISKLLGG